MSSDPCPDSCRLITFCACTSSGETASARSSTVSSPAAAVSCGRNPMVAFFSISIAPVSGETSPRRSANNVDLPAPLGPTNPIRSPRLTWSETSSKSARPAKDFESCETVSIAESAQCPLVQRPAQLVSHEQTSLYPRIIDVKELQVFTWPARIDRCLTNRNGIGSIHCDENPRDDQAHRGGWLVSGSNAR